jgi:putative NADPH-quinone reductase
MDTAPVRGTCPLQDGMATLLARIDAADALVLAAPMNFGSATAITKRFIERLICYSDWPWGQPAPRLRRDSAKEQRHRPALLMTSSAAPALLGRLLGQPLKELRQAAVVLGFEPAGSLWHGRSAQRPRQAIGAGTKRRAGALGRRLVVRALRAAD